MIDTKKYLLITEVDYNNKRIERVKITSPKHYPPMVSVRTRKEAVILIDNFIGEFCTEGVDSDGVPFLTKVQTIHTESDTYIYAGSYIKTEPNSTVVDNLENLPPITPPKPGEYFLSFDALCTYIRQHF